MEENRGREGQDQRLQWVNGSRVDNFGWVM